MPALQSLIVNSSNLHGEAIEWIAKSIEEEQWHGLRVLSLVDASLTDQDVEKLMRAINKLPLLDTLELGCRRELGQEGMVPFAVAIKMGALSGLRKLSIAGCGITALCEVCRADPCCLKHLKDLRIRDNALTNKGFESFVKH